MRLIAASLSIALLLTGVCFGAASLPRETITIDTARGPHKFEMEIAGDGPSQDRGLMFRKHLAPDAGMLFDFHQNVMTAFWMKNTEISLDMLFVRADGTVSTIAARAVPYSTKEIISAEPIRAVIEIGGGRAKALGITPGDLVHAKAFGTAALVGTRKKSGLK